MSREAKALKKGEEPAWAALPESIRVLRHWSLTRIRRRRRRARPRRCAAYAGAGRTRSSAVARGWRARDGLRGCGRARFRTAPGAPRRAGPRVIAAWRERRRRRGSATHFWVYARCARQRRERRGRGLPDGPDGPPSVGTAHSARNGRAGVKPAEVDDAARRRRAHHPPPVALEPRVEMRRRRIGGQPRHSSATGPRHGERLAADSRFGCLKPYSVTRAPPGVLADVTPCRVSP